MLTEETFLSKNLSFRDRQAGVSLIYSPFEDRFVYNAYCMETKLLKELCSVEFAELDEALDFVNQEFGSWDLVSLGKEDSGCGSCAAKK